MADLIITLTQTDLAWENKSHNLEHFENLLNTMEGKKQLVILPEMFSTAFSMNPKALAEPMNGPTHNWMRTQAAKHKIILCGSIIIEENSRFYNRLLWILPTGETAQYDKRHLFSFAGEGIEFTPGNKRVIVQVNGWRILLQICYDLRFPVYARMQNKNEYDAILYIANWPEKRITAWDSLLRARAIENQCYVIGVNRLGRDDHGNYYNGSSSVIDPNGNYLYNKVDEEDVKTLVLSKTHVENTREQLPFLCDKDAFFLK